jgi:hypothetical protein
MNWGITLVNASSVFGVRDFAEEPLAEGPRTAGRDRNLVLAPGGRDGKQLVLRREQQARTEVDQVRGPREPQRQEGGLGGDDHR